MNKTTQYDLDISKKLLITTEELQILLSCGRYSACKIGENAGARFVIGKRILWNREKVEKYIENISV